MDARDRLIEMHAVERLAARDASLFADPGIAADRLGWVDAGARAVDAATGLRTLAAELTSPGITDVVVLGMGGSSLPAVVLSRTIGSAPGAPTLHVLDTTSPSQVAAALRSLAPATTLVLVASKSGSTVEPLALLDVFRPWLTDTLGAEAGSHLVAVTDSGSSLEALALAEGFASIVRTPYDIGGRYSALTPFGLFPAALAGIDVARLATTAAAFEDACRTPSADNPAIALTSWMADACAVGRDKLAVVCSPRLASFGLWVEQLVAESTGKGGAGLLPVLEDSPGLPAAHAADRMTFVLRLEDDTVLAGLADLLPDGEPVFEVVVDDAYSLAAEFVHWTWAVALFAALEGIEPFDQPDVEEAKSATRAILLSGDETPGESVPASPDGPQGDLAARVRALLGDVPDGGYLAVLAYLPEDESLLGPLRAACADVAVAHRVPVTLELGPRYLHSTGQFHKGGTPNGSFLVITAPAADTDGLRSLARLNAAQAAGDASALVAHGRPVLAIVLDGDTVADLDPLLDAMSAERSGT